MVKNKTAKAGLDIGYSHTKIATGEKGDIIDSFKSIVREGEIDINKDAILIDYEGRRYTVGENYGRQIFETKKTHDINFDICLMASLARTNDVSELEINLVTGLPIAYYQAQKDELTQYLTNKQFEFAYNGKDRRFNIRAVSVFPQSAGLPLLYPKEFEDKKVLVTDIGGLTVDVSYFEDGRLVDYNSYDKGILMFHKHLAKLINGKYSTRFDFQDMERVVEHGITIEEKKIPEAEFSIKLQQEIWVQSIMDKVKADFPWGTVDNRSWIGGGSKAFKGFLPETNSIKSDEVFANAKAFYSVGVQLFG
jgi:plasmid segregation protein ParM